MVDSMASSMHDTVDGAMASTMDHAMASAMYVTVGVTPWMMSFRVTCLGCPWHIPWMYTMGETTESSMVHHGRRHGRRRGSATYHSMLRGTCHGSMDEAMVLSMDESLHGPRYRPWMTMGSSVDDATALGVHDIVHGRRHGIVHGRRP